jgi:alkaline phosphatase
MKDAKNTTKYVDGFVLAIPEKNLPEYKKMALMGGKVWKKHGALEYFECAGDDLSPTMGGMKFLKFSKLANAKPGETVVFSFIVFKSRAHRDSVNAKVMKEFMQDPKNKNKEMPFDMKRMAYGGFKTLVNF